MEGAETSTSADILCGIYSITTEIRLRHSRKRKANSGLTGIRQTERRMVCSPQINVKGKVLWELVRVSLKWLQSSKNRKQAEESKVLGNK